MATPKQQTDIDKEVSPNFDPYQIILSHLSTEKSIRQIEFGNCLVFSVSLQSTKQDIKKAVEQLFKVKVIKVNVHNSFAAAGKRAFVTLAAQNVASDIGADLGLI